MCTFRTNFQLFVDESVKQLWEDWTTRKTLNSFIILKIIGGKTKTLILEQIVENGTLEDLKDMLPFNQCKICIFMLDPYTPNFMQIFWIPHDSIISERFIYFKVTKLVRELFPSEFIQKQIHASKLEEIDIQKACPPKQKSARKT